MFGPRRDSGGLQRSFSRRRATPISDFDVRSTSPGGRYIVGVDSSEAHAFQWVDTPDVVDCVRRTASLNGAEPQALGRSTTSCAGPTPKAW